MSVSRYWKVACALVACAAGASAPSHAQAVFSRTPSFTVGTGANGRWQVSCRQLGPVTSTDCTTAGTPFADVAEVTTSLVGGGWVPNDSFGRWVAVNNSAIVASARGEFEDFEYIFRTTFTWDGPVTTADFTAGLYADGSFRGWRGNEGAWQAVAGLTDRNIIWTDRTRNMFTFVMTVLPGLNTLDFRVTGNGLNDGINVALVGYVPEPSTPLLLGAGVLVLGVAARMAPRRSADGAGQRQ